MSVGFFFLLLILSTLIDFSLGHLIYRAGSRRRSLFFLWLSMAANLGLPVATNVVKVDVDNGSVLVESEREAGTIDVVRMTAPCVIGAGKGLNMPNYPTIPNIMKSRKKSVRKIGMAELAIEKPATGMEIEELVPAVEQRDPKALTGSAADIAAQIVDILKNEAKVI